jgi:opacity protein-like surface antigen
MKKLIAVAVAVLALASAPVAQAEDYTVAVALQGLTDPHIVGGVSYNENAVGQKWQAMITANILGPKLGSLPCYVSGIGVGLNTVAPGLEDAPIAAWSMPLLTCAPFGEQVVIQTGLATALNGGGDRTYYVGVGVSLSGGPEVLSVKRAKRVAAKKAQQKADALKDGPVPASAQ